MLGLGDAGHKTVQDLQGLVGGALDQLPRARPQAEAVEWDPEVPVGWDSAVAATRS